MNCVASKESRTRTQHGPSTGKEQGRYANFFQIGHNAFEFWIEFGQQDGGIHTRIYVSPRHARILSDLLVEALTQYEIAFGSLPKGY
jgi:hypothetical protein